MAKSKEIKKHWASVLATKEFGNMELAEIPYSEPETLIGRVLKVNLYIITNDSRKQNAELSFKITNFDGKSASTELIGYKILNAYIKRVIRKAKEKVDDSFECSSKDNIKMKIKPFFITKSKTKNSVVTKLRMNIRQMMTEYSKTIDFEKLIRETTTNNLQRNLKQELKKTYPLNLLELREIVRIK